MSWINGILAKKLGLNETDNSTLAQIALADTLAIAKRPEFLSDSIEIKTIQATDPKVSETALLQRVASLASHDSTPLGRAIILVAKAKKIELLETTQVKSLEGGVSGFVMDRKMVLGTAQCLKKENINLGPLQALTTALVKDGQTVALVAAESKPIGLIAAHAPIRTEIMEQIKPFEGHHFKVIWVPPFDEKIAFEFRREGKSLAAGKDLSAIAPTLKIVGGIGAQKRMGWIISLLFIGGGLGLFFGLDSIEGLIGSSVLALVNVFVFPIWKGNQLIRSALNTPKA